MRNGKGEMVYRLSIALLMVAFIVSGCDDPPEEPADDEELVAEAEPEPEEDPEEELETEQDLFEISGIGDDADRPEEMARTWQLGAFGVGAGLAATYHFFDDGLFVFNSGSTDECEPGVRARVGTWHVDGEELVLQEQRRLEHEGGQKVDDPTFGCVLQEPDRQVSAHEEPQEIRIEISECPDEELEKHASEIDELGVACHTFDGDVHWTVAAGTESWRDSWKDWFQAAMEE